jgi:hypothetical protein
VHVRVIERAAGGDAPIGEHEDDLIEGLVKGDLGGHAATHREGDATVTEIAMRVGYAAGSKASVTGAAHDASPPNNGVGGSPRVRAAR